MKKFKFYNDIIIEANNEEDAKSKFADQSYNFAADADIEEVEEINTNNKGEAFNTVYDWLSLDSHTPAEVYQALNCLNEE